MSDLNFDSDKSSPTVLGSDFDKLVAEMSEVTSHMGEDVSVCDLPSFKTSNSTVHVYGVSGNKS